MNVREPVPFKAKDACWTVTVIDPLAGWLVGLVRDRHVVTPNRVTAVATVLAVLAATAFAAERLALGAILFQLSFLLDCVDGKLAQAREQRDPLGAMIDLSADAVRVMVCATALAVALSHARELTVDGVSLSAALVCLFLGAHVAVDTVARSRPASGVSAEGRTRGYLWLPPRPVTILRHAPRRAVAPGSTVDTEALAFTLGPLLGVPVVALGVAVAFDLAWAAVFYARAVARRRSLTQDLDETRS